MGLGELCAKLVKSVNIVGGRIYDDRERLTSDVFWQTYDVFRSKPMFSEFTD